MNPIDKPNIIINGKVTFIKLGIRREDKSKILLKSMLRLFKTVNNLDNCSNQAIDIKIKKTSVQDLKI